MPTQNDFKLPVKFSVKIIYSIEKFDWLDFYNTFLCIFVVMISVGLCFVVTCCDIYF